MDEFDSQEIIELVENALAGDAFQPGHVLPLAYNEGRLLEVLSDRLVDYLPEPDVQVILDELRSELYSGIEVGTAKDLHSIIKNCRKCPLAIPAPYLPDWNVADPDVIFVAEQPLRDKEAIGLFINSLGQAGFSSQRIMLTYVNRCRFKQGKPTVDDIKNCIGYLHSEIQILKPKLVVTLGLLPTASLLGADLKITEARGSICWLGPWAILPTFSPNYAVKGSPQITQSLIIDVKTAYDFTYGEK
jgi:uracil-DNA glycosylase family 4